VKRLVGRTDIEDALKRLEKLSNDEALTATVQILRVADRVDNRIEEVVDGAQGVFWPVSLVDLNDHVLRCKGSKSSNTTDGERSW
jgi:hypothetical protein